MLVEHGNSTFSDVRSMKERIKLGASAMYWRLALDVYIT